MSPRISQERCALAFSGLTSEGEPCIRCTSQREDVNVDIGPNSIVAISATHEHRQDRLVKVRNCVNPAKCPAFVKIAPFHAHLGLIEEKF